MKAVLVICEGRSDTAFVRRSLVAISACKGFNEGIGDLPAPFGSIPSTSEKGLIAKHIETCFGHKPADAWKLSSIAFLPPQFDTAVLSKEGNVIYLLVNAGGRDQYNGTINLLEKVHDAMSIAGRAINLDIKEYATAFLFDANDRGIEKVMQDFCKNYGDYFGCLSNLSHANWVESCRCPIGIYICCDDSGTGALENYVMPMTKSVWSERHKRASNFIDQNKNPNDRVSKTETNRQKAIIASIGQFNFPGNSLLSLIDDESNGIPDEQFRNSKACSDLVKFFQNVPWKVWLS